MTIQNRVNFADFVSNSKQRKLLNQNVFQNILKVKAVQHRAQNIRTVSQFYIFGEGRSGLPNHRGRFPVQLQAVSRPDKHEVAGPFGPEDTAGGATCWQHPSSGHWGGWSHFYSFTSHSGGTSLFSFTGGGATWGGLYIGCFPERVPTHDQANQSAWQ